MLPIARVLKSNGSDGELLVGFRGFDPDDIDLQEPVFIEFDGLPVPFFMESFTRRGTGKALVRLTGIRSLADAEEVAGETLYLDRDESADNEDITGWTLCDADGTAVGTVVDYEDIPGNTCIWVDTKNGQVLLPFHEALILSVDEASKTLAMRIPTGLLPA